MTKSNPALRVVVSPVAHLKVGLAFYVLLAIIYFVKWPLSMERFQMFNQQLGYIAIVGGSVGALAQVLINGSVALYRRNVSESSK